MFSLSTFQSNGQSQNLFHLRDIQKDVTIKSDLETLIDQFKNVVFVMVNLEYQYKTTLEDLLPDSVNKVFKPDVENKLNNF